ncbi:Cathepsin_B [Hexamita inflata]|uniref:Cathepsin B n=1 Tax=Hexamita inflata TaxID=28002 RepID=A0AA86US22_9EUKA|nr:Cathepsin B [Hexamita inflata]
MSVLMRRENTLIIEPGSDISKIQIINFILLPNSKKHFEGPPLQFYGGGIYQHEYGQMTGYKGVEIVGFGEDDGNKYWKVKLDKGTEWGEEGYLRIIKGIDDCFIESNAYTISIPE